MEAEPAVYRTCTKCKKPITDDNKLKDSSQKGGIYPQCRSCKYTYTHSLRHRIKTGKHRPKNISHTKTCIYCNEELTSETAYRNKYTSTGLHNTCKRCSGSASSTWSKNHPDKRKLYKHNRRTKELHMVSTLTNEEWNKCLEYFDYKCAYCSRERKLQVEHVVPVANPKCPGTVAENVVPACRSCNSSKNSHNVYLWLCKKYGVQRAVLVYNRIIAYLSYAKEERYKCLNGRV